MVNENPERDRIQIALMNAPDARVASLVSGDIDEAVALISPHVDKTRTEFEFRYLTPGKSGAFVVLLVFSDALARVIKVGPQDLIEREMQNYTTFELANFISSECILQPLGTMAKVGSRASVAFHWAGGRSRVATVRESLFALDADIVGQLLAEAAKHLFPWHRVRPSSSSPVDLFLWEPGAKSKIADVLHALEGLPERENLLRFLNVEPSVRDLFQTTRGSLSFTHGDFHGGNLLVIGSGASCHLRIIDFASIQQDMCPARDWAKLERDVRYRCRRPESLGSLRRVADLLRLALDGKMPATSEIEPAAAAVRKIRSEYERHCRGSSDDWELEYLYFLLCWSLNELHANPFVNESADRIAIAEACGETCQALMRRLGPRGAYADVPRERTDNATNSFLSDTRIAGYVRRRDGTERALYLDSGLYVSRHTEEGRIDEIVQDYVIRGVGRWVSVFGDAGHGKTSLMWRLAVVYGKSKARLLAIQCQQLGQDPIKELASQLEEVQGGKTVVLLDTLDLLIGIDDQRLGSTLGHARAAGLLLVSTSRRQEIQELAKYVLSDDPIELTRFDPEEAKIAVRKYVDAAYEGLTDEQSVLQFESVWEILDQQRKFQDLTFEPLILRMIFQAYVPDAIPQDINTQRVYDKFWDERVLSDRTAKSGQESFYRARGCELIADSIGFGEGIQKDTLACGSAAQALQTGGDEDAIKTIESLVSTGALRWGRGRSAVRFFHQTFLEYCAARAVLFMEDKQARGARIQTLLEDLRESRLFRLPILKQLAIQARHHGDDLWPVLAKEIEGTGNQVAAKLALEIAGKIDDEPIFANVVLRWAERDKKLFESVTVDMARAYPVSRFGFAFQLLELQLESKRESDIYSLCQKTFAAADPGQTLGFLAKAGRRVRKGRHDENAEFRQAVMATLRAGQGSALTVLGDVFPRFSPGLQNAVLEELCQLARPEFAEGVRDLLASGAELIIAGKQRMFQTPYYDLLRWLHGASPSIAEELIHDINRRCLGATNTDAAILGAKSQAVLPQSPETLGVAVKNLASSDFSVQIATSEFLAEVGRRSSEEVLNAVIRTAGSPIWNQREATKFLFLALRTTRAPDGSRISTVLNRWDIPDRGAGNAFRGVFGQLVKADANAAREWLLRRKGSVQSAAELRIIMVGAQLLSEESPLVMSEDDVRGFVELGSLHPEASSETQRIACSVVGRCFPVAPGYCEQEIVRIFGSRNRDWISATIKALGGNVWTSLPLLVLRLILNHKPGRNRDLFLGLFLETISGLPFLAKAELLREMGGHAATVLPTIEDEGAQLGVLTLAKSTAQHDPKTALSIAKALQSRTPAAFGNLLAVYENITLVSADPGLYRETLEELMKASRHRHRYIRNSLNRALPRIEEVLGPRTAVDAIKATVVGQAEWDEGALEDLVRAAKDIPSWTLADSEELRALGLPAKVSAILLGGS
jgi:hypothetical protein